MATLINSTIGISRKKPRVWVEGSQISKGGLDIGTVLYGVFDTTKSRCVASSKEVDAYDFKVKVSKRTNKNGSTKPLLEVRHDKFADMFGVGSDIRIVIKNGKMFIRKYIQNEGMKSRLEEAKRLVESGETVKISELFKVLSPEEIDARKRERLERLIEKVKRGESFTIGSLFHGGGTLDRVFHDGFTRAGLSSYVKIVTDCERSFLSASITNNKMLWGEDSLFIESPVEMINFSEAGGYVDICVAGLPCTGASPSGKTSNKLSKAEHHKKSGMAFVSFCEAILFLNPISVQFENVVQYAKTESYTVICEVLKYLGYNVVDGTLNGNDFGALEARKRLCMVATTDGIPAFDFELLEPMKKSVSGNVADILVDIDANDDRWRERKYLVDKEVRDKAAGKGFARTLLTGDEVSVPVIKRTNHKAQSDGIFIVHPVKPELNRMPMKLEHAAIKQVPFEVVSGLSETVACEILGQGVIGSVFDAVGYAHATTLKSVA